MNNNYLSTTNNYMYATKNRKQIIIALFKKTTEQDTIIK